ncbi:hypothetical protein DL767_002847 [Monosporascus sp. MG133]|nr:hypothetical protein DL767_002847 [Monosporascus sp. MG133]
MVNSILTWFPTVLQAGGYNVQLCEFYNTPPRGRDIMAVLDAKQPFLHDMTGHPYEIDFTTLELDRSNSAGWDAIAGVFGEFQTRNSDGEFKPTLEWALADGAVQVGRFHWISVDKELAGLAPPPTARKLDISKRGFLSTLHWQHFEPPTLRPGWIKIKTVAVGLNFMDVLIAMGIVEATSSRATVLDVNALAWCLSTLVTHESVCARIPGTLSFTDAATVLLVYCTTIPALTDRAQLGKGQSVLIHSACGGVGIAALYLAQAVGAEEKANYIVREFGIPRDHIFSSRDLSFKRDVLAKTNGRGVDVVLNSPSGELLHASWDCVATFRYLVEIGKRDLVGRGSLAFALFQYNHSYICVHFAQIAQAKPIGPVTVFHGMSVEDAMRFMQKGDHLGKVVVTLPDNPEELDVKSLPIKPELALDESASYLFDRNLSSMAFDNWQAAADPKVKGTCNLHESLLQYKHTLDFFIVFSSWSGLVGQPGQANYASGNTYLDTFVQYRHSQGLPASAIDIGVTDDVGYVSQSARLLDFFRMTSTHILYEQDILDSIQLLMAHSPVTHGLDVNKSPRSQEKTESRSENEELREFVEFVAATPALLDNDDSVMFLAEEIGRTLLSFMLQGHENLDINLAPSSIGVDSLVAIELRNQFCQSLGLEMTVLGILGSDSLLALGRLETATNDAQTAIYGTSTAPSIINRGGDSKEARPCLILIISWMAASTRHVRVYLEKYKALYPDATTIHVASSMLDTAIRPDSARRRELKPTVDAIISWLSLHPPQSQPRVLLHLFSNAGAYTAGLLATSYQARMNAPLPATAVVLDSSPGRATFGRLFHAFTLPLAPLPVVVRALGTVFVVLGLAIVIALQRIGVPDAVDWSRRILNDGQAVNPRALRLYLNSKADDMVPWSDAEDHAKEAEARGIPVRRVVLEKSAHCRHAQLYSDEYWGAIGEILTEKGLVM